jgi:hypothetical protein
MMNIDTEFCVQREPDHDWTLNASPRAHWLDRDRGFKKLLAEMWIFPQAEVSSPREETTATRFLRLADEWSRETGHISSASDLINNARYQEIISLGWAVVPCLLIDLERSRRFWFPALAAITGLRPFDPGDASNYRRMTDAWLRWGKRKGLI